MIRRKTVFLLAGVLLLAPIGRAGYRRTFDTGSLIIPMDLAYQQQGLLQAYGLVFQLLRQGVKVYWVIELDKTWHAAPCDTPGDECPWDCTREGSGTKCPYPTASPDFFASAEVVWDDRGRDPPGTDLGRHGYRAGPFVIDSSDAARALPIIDAWNDQDLWDANPWAERSVFHVVSVHRATEQFAGYVRKEMIAAPTIAVFSDGNEDIATAYLRAAGIKQSNGAEFPADKCDKVPCGPGTENPDMLTVPSIMGDMGTCDAPNNDHRNGALFTPDGVPAYCQIMSMHWNVDDRETVECNGAACPADPADCAGQPITYHGHEVVAEVRQFLYFPVHFFAECQAVNAYENTTPNPAWPYLDDTDRDGHFLTTYGVPPDCNQGNCADADFQCVAGGCDAGARDCCLPRDRKERGAGFMIENRPASDTIQVLHPEVPYNQFDGFFETVGGSEQAYNLSAFLGTTYKNDLEVVFITGPNGPGVQDVWMTGYLDGECDITDPFLDVPENCQTGKVSYLGGHKYNTAVPIDENQNHDSQGTRLFLNALFEADCVTNTGQPELLLDLSGPERLSADSLPAGGRYTALFLNAGAGPALDAVLRISYPAGVEVSAAESGAQIANNEVSWDIGSIGTSAARPGEPPHQGGRWLELSFPGSGSYPVRLEMTYRVGVSTMTAGPVELTVEVAPGAVDGGSDAGSDGGPGDAGGDEVGADDGGEDGGGDVAGGDAGGGKSGSGCGCAAGGRSAGAGRGLLVLLLPVLAGCRRRRRVHRGRTA